MPSQKGLTYIVSMRSFSSHENEKAFAFGWKVAACWSWVDSPGFSLGLGEEAQPSVGRLLQVVLSKHVGSTVHDPLFFKNRTKLSLKYQNVWCCPVTHSPCFFFFSFKK